MLFIRSVVSTKLLAQSTAVPRLTGLTDALPPGWTSPLANAASPRWTRTSPSNSTTYHRTAVWVATAMGEVAPSVMTTVVLVSSHVGCVSGPPRIVPNEQWTSALVASTGCRA